jgi:hypothetical protein
LEQVSKGFTIWIERTNLLLYSRSLLFLRPFLNGTIQDLTVLHTLWTNERIRYFLFDDRTIAPSFALRAMLQKLLPLFLTMVCIP